METPSPAEQNALIHQLQERIKELNCLYTISLIGANPKATLDSILQKIADAIPLGFQWPESTCERTHVVRNARRMRRRGAPLGGTHETL